jgi:hypothetical protein
MEVAYFKNKYEKIYKPGLASLSDYEQYKNHRDIIIKPLNDTNWYEHVKNNEPPDPFALLLQQKLLLLLLLLQQKLAKVFLRKDQKT